MNELRRYEFREVQLTRDANRPSITGYASVFFDGTERTEFELFPGVRERVDPSAFDKTLSRGDDVRALFNHDPTQILGRSTSGTLRLRTDAIGLRYDVDLGESSIARDVAEHIQRRDVTGSSFAFLIREEDWETLESGVDIRTVKQADLFDVGPVTFPAYEGSAVELKSFQIEEARRSWAAYTRARKDRWLRRSKKVIDLSRVRR